MTVVVELDDDPPRLRRADGLMVRFPRDEDGSYPAIEAGWLKADSEFELLLRWRGFVYQELQPAVVKDGDPGRDVLLVGHIPGGGYCSAVVGLGDTGMIMEFADQPPVGADGLQRIEFEEISRRRWDVKGPLCSPEATCQRVQKRRNPDGTTWSRFLITRKPAAAAIQHLLGLRSILKRG